jgi:hypothetical protein
MPQVLNIDNLSEKDLESYIVLKEDFQLQGKSKSQSKKVVIIEKLLEKNGFSVRVKTHGREASLLIPIPVNIFNWIGQGMHNLATYDPDWVIYKHKLGSDIDVKYFKS